LSHLFSPITNLETSPYFQDQFSLCSKINQ